MKLDLNPLPVGVRKNEDVYSYLLKQGAKSISTALWNFMMA